MTNRRVILYRQCGIDAWNRSVELNVDNWSNYANDYAIVNALIALVENSFLKGRSLYLHI